MPFSPGTEKGEKSVMEQELVLLQQEELICKLITACMRREGFQMEGEEGTHFSSSDRVVLMAVTVMMTNGDQAEDLRHTLQYRMSPVALLQNDSAAATQRLCYNTRPIILAGRAKRIGRTMPRELPDISLGELTVCYNKRQVFLRGESIPMTRKEIDLLSCLTMHRNLVMTRAQLLESVWGYDFSGDARTVDTHIKRLRAKLQDYGRCILTIRGVGYRFVWEE